MRLDPGDALIVVDVQRDFCPGGALAVPEGDRVVPALVRYIRLFRDRRLPIIFTRDWHPPDHCSFRERGGPWPVHCVAGTRGAEFHPGLPPPPEAEVVSKATSRDGEAYSAFQGTDLGERLRSRGARRILVGGLATEYCVKATVLDWLKEGFEAAFLLDSIGAVDLRPGDGERAIGEMESAGAEGILFEDLAPEAPRSCPRKSR